MESELGLTQLKLLKKVFEDADDDGSGELDIDEFCEQLGPYLGKDLTKQQISQLFMKIDADAGGTVDWDEFSNYMFLKRAENDEDSAESWKLFPVETPGRHDNTSMHGDLVEKVLYFSELDKYITCGRDATFRVWNTSDLRHNRTLNNGLRWVSDAVYLKQHRKLCVASMDRSLTWYDVNRGSYECIGKLHTSGTMGTPTCVNRIVLNETEQVMYGDSLGMVNMILAETNESFKSRDLLYTEHTQDYVCLHDRHDDWVTRVRCCATRVEHIEEVGLVTASMDSQIYIFDVNRDGVMHQVKHHRKGVLDFSYCRPYSLFASCGERSIMLWQAQNGRLVGELTGHTAVVSRLAIDDERPMALGKLLITRRQCQLFSMSMDNVIKVWDLRTNKCTQTITQDEWPQSEDAQPHSMVYDTGRKHLITASRRPFMWEHKLIMKDRTGHRSACVKAVYNSIFFVVVSVDDTGCIISWNIHTGERESRFFNAHGGSKVTCIAFDANERRLLSSANDGLVKIWNFNNGSMLRMYTHDEEQPQEISRVFYVQDEKRGQECVYAAGWNRKVYIWEDMDEDVVEDFKTLEGHDDDILSMDICMGHLAMATGDYEGRINIWNLNSGEKRMSLYHRSDRYENGVDCLQWIPLGEQHRTVVLLSAGGDGVLRVWSVGVTGHLMCTLKGATGHLETVKDLCVDEDFQHLVVSDSSGHIRMLDISQLDISSPTALSQSFKQVLHFRVSEAAVNGVTCVKGQELILAASADTSVHMYNYKGGLVGTFGIHEWILDDVATHQDPDAHNTLPVLDPVEALCSVAAVRDAVPVVPKEEEKEPLPWEGVPPASYYMKARRERIQLAVTQKPRDTVHGMLKVLPAKELPRTIDEVLNRAPKKKGGKAKTAQTHIRP